MEQIGDDDMRHLMRQSGQAKRAVTPNVNQPP